MAKLLQLFVLQQMLNFIFSDGLPCTVIVEIDSEVEVTKQEHAIVRHCFRQRLCFAERFVKYGFDHLSSLVNFSVSRGEMAIQKGEAGLFNAESEGARTFVFGNAS